MPMNRANQWLLKGRCDICRREAYCTKPCRKRKQLLERQKADMSRGVFAAVERAYKTRMPKIDKVNDQVFSALGASLEDQNQVDGGIFDALAEKL